MSTHPIIIIGAGDHSQVLIDALQLTNHEILYLTDVMAEKHGQSILDVPILGDDKIILNHARDEIQLVNGTSSTDRPTLRQKIYETWTSQGYQFSNVIHPSSILSPNIHIGHGVQILAGAIVQSGASLGDNTTLNTGSRVDHGCVLGNHTQIAPGATICGQVRIGDACHIGAGATVIQGVTIGNDCVIGAGSVVIRDIPNGSKVVGVPSRPIR